MVYNGNPIKMDDLGVPLFLETPIFSQMVVNREFQKVMNPMAPWETHQSNPLKNGGRQIQSKLILKDRNPWKSTTILEMVVPFG